MATSQSSRLGPAAHQSARCFSSSSRANGRITAKPAYRFIPTTSASAVKLREKTVTPSASPDVLRKLVALHHTSASFMHDPSTAGIGFQNAFQYSHHEPHFLTYDSWARSVLKGHHSSNKFVPRERGFDSEELRGDARPAQNFWATFKQNDRIGGKRFNNSQPMTERDRHVRETIFGTWERGGLGMEGSRPSFDGLKEWMRKKKVSSAAAQREWIGLQQDLAAQERIEAEAEAERRRVAQAEAAERDAQAADGGAGAIGQ